MCSRRARNDSSNSTCVLLVQYLLACETIDQKSLGERRACKQRKKARIAFSSNTRLLSAWYMYTLVAPLPRHPAANIPTCSILATGDAQLSRLAKMRLRRPSILGPHEIRKRLRFLILMMRVVAMLFTVSVMRVRVVGRADVFHAVGATAFRAALDGAFAGHLLLGGVG